MNKSFFDLPVYSKRDSLADWFLKSTLTTDMKRSDNDGYCYYLCFKWTVVICLFFSLLNWLSYDFGINFNFYFFKIDLHGREIVHQFLMSYPFYMGVIIELTCVPFFFFKVKANIPWGKNSGYDDFDPFWWNKRVNRRLFPAKELLKRGRGLTIVFMILSPCSFSTGHFFAFLAPSLRESHVYLEILLIAYPLLIGMFSVGILMPLVAWRFYAKFCKEQKV